MERVRPLSGGETRLMVSGYFAAFRSGRGSEPVYEIVDDGKTQRLGGAQRADWDPEGRLLVATTDCRLQIRDVADRQMSVRSEVDLSTLSPESSPPPDEAYRW